MHTIWVRLNAVVFFGLTVIVSLAVLTWVSTIGHQGFPTVDVLRVNSVKTLRSHVRSDATRAPNQTRGGARGGARGGKPITHEQAPRRDMTTASCPGLCGSAPLV